MGNNNNNWRTVQMDEVVNNDNEIQAHFMCCRRRKGAVTDGEDQENTETKYTLAFLPVCLED
jgi:hypothetical protein